MSLSLTFATNLFSSSLDSFVASFVHRSLAIGPIPDGFTMDN